MSSELDKVVQPTVEINRLTSEDRPEVSVGTVRNPQQPSQVIAELSDKMIEQQKPEAEQVKPLSYWTSDIKETFNSAPMKIKRVWLNTVRKSENIHRRLSQQLKKDYSVWDQVNQILSPQYQRLQQQKLSLPEYINALISLEQQLLKDPRKFILDTLVHFKYKPEDVASWVNEYINVVQKEQDMAPLKKRIDHLEQQLNTATAPQPISQDTLLDGQVIAQELQYFFSQTDERGELLYPRFTEVAYLMPEMNATYGTEDYESLYELACLKKDNQPMPDPRTYNPDIKYYSQNKQKKTPYNPKSQDAIPMLDEEQELPDLVPLGPEDQSYDELVKALSEEWDVRNSGR